MGYCISDGDFPQGIAPGEVDAEARRESFCLTTQDHHDAGWGALELLYTDIPRLKRLIAFLEEHYYDTRSEVGLPDRHLHRTERTPSPHG